MVGRFNPEIFLEIAKKIKIAKDLEEVGRIRTSIGRAYYSAFLLSRIKCEKKGKVFGTEAQHKDVMDFLKTIYMDHASNLLKTLFDYRVEADYDLNAKIDISLCDKCIRIAEKIIEEIEVI